MSSLNTKMKNFRLTLSSDLSSNRKTSSKRQSTGNKKKLKDSINSSEE